MLLWWKRARRFLGKATLDGWGWEIRGFRPVRIVRRDWRYDRVFRPLDLGDRSAGDWHLERCETCKSQPDIVSGGGENLMVRCPTCRVTGTMVGELAHIVSIWNAK